MGQNMPFWAKIKVLLHLLLPLAYVYHSALLNPIKIYQNPSKVGRYPSLRKKRILTIRRPRRPQCALRRAIKSVVLLALSVVGFRCCCCRCWSRGLYKKSCLSRSSAAKAAEEFYWHYGPRYFWACC